MESFFSTLEAELLESQTLKSFEETKVNLLEYIEGFYNRERMHATLDFLSHYEFNTRPFVSHPTYG